MLRILRTHQRWLLFRNTAFGNANEGRFMLPYVQKGKCKRNIMEILIKKIND